MDAIIMEDTARVDPDRCIGCGLCVTDCPEDAMTLKQKDGADQYVPPKHTFETYSFAPDPRFWIDDLLLLIGGSALLVKI